jgi:hypothetical protein
MLSQTGIIRDGHAHSYYAQATWTIPGKEEGEVTRYCFVEMTIRIGSGRSERVSVTGGDAVCSPSSNLDPSTPNSSAP